MAQLPWLAGLTGQLINEADILNSPALHMTAGDKLTMDYSNRHGSFAAFDYSNA